MVLFQNMNEEGDVVMEIWRNKFIGENSNQTEAWARERSTFVKQFGDLKRGGRMVEVFPGIM